MANARENNSVTELRLQLLANGYSPIPNYGKACFIKKWPTLEITPEAIEGWQGRKSEARRFVDTGLRVENGLAVIDLDVDHEVIDAIADAFEATEPELLKSLVRYGKGRKMAWFLRTDEPFTRLHTRRWLAPGENVEEHGTHVVEIFGGASPRQFGAFGAHTRAPNGEVEIAYEWAGDSGPDDRPEWTPQSPASTPIALLPILSKAQFAALVDLAERVLEEHDFTYVAKTQKGESEATRVYDLTEDLVFETNTGEDEVPFTVLRARAGEEGLRVSASFIEPGRQHSRTRCLVGTAHSGEMTIWDSATGVTHMPADAAPAAAAQRQVDTSAVAERLQRLAAAEEERKTLRRLKPTSEDSAAQVAGKLTQTHGYCRTQTLDVVPLYADSVSDGIALTKFRNSMVRYAEVEIGPRGGEKKINPVDIWLASDQLVMVDGLRMRPDRGRPTYQEEGKTYVNVYKAVEHPVTGGRTDVWHEFLEYLLPEPTERQYFERWLAFKFRNPSIPGPAVVMVARAHGTGRGTLSEIIRRLFGARYVKALDFNTFAGKTYQSQYNSWGAETLLVTVNESEDSNGGNRYQGKRDTYERLKDLIEPRPIERHFVRHGLPPFSALSFTSYFIATNHVDALPLPKDDRRIWVGSNGEPNRDVGYWTRLNAWMEQPENIGALARWLGELDLGSYSPYAPPPMTKAKSAMTEMNASALDRALETALEALPGELLLPDQVLEAMRLARDEDQLDFPDRWEHIARRLIQAKLVRIADKDAPGWAVKIDGKKHPIYARSEREGRRWAAAEGEERRVEILRNGEPGKGVEAALAKLKLVVDNKG